MIIEKEFTNNTEPRRGDMIMSSLRDLNILFQYFYNHVIPSGLV